MEQNQEIVAGENIKIVIDPETNEKILSAPTLNHTSIKHGPFKISGEFIEIEAGRGIIISTAMPNKLKISADNSKLITEILDLKERFNNLEKLYLDKLKGS